MRKNDEELRKATEELKKMLNKSRVTRRRISYTIYVIYALFIASCVYKYFVTGDHVCNLLIGKKKEICKIKYRIKALLQQQDNLKKSLLNAKNTSDPEKTKVKIQKKINDISKNIKSLKNKLKELNV